MLLLGFGLNFWIFILDGILIVLLIIIYLFICNVGSRFINLVMLFGVVVFIEFWLDELVNFIEIVVLIWVSIVLEIFDGCWVIIVVLILNFLFFLNIFFIFFFVYL